MRYFKLWLCIGWLLILLLCYFSLTLNPPKIDIKFEYLDKLEHMFSYFVLMSWFAQLYHSKLTRVYYALFFIALGITLEVLQGLGGIRYFEYADMLANTTGVVIACLVTKNRGKDLLFMLERRIFHK
ncbi:MAG: VanZ family protein [Gammaproteobacteria bacterium]|nr:VanZ family protein [Gammaproteobacteria bacterium]MCW8986465.1 VanZ family protein [Gammaproteobacteria bacterium]MCW9031445.1 VanZ family protein [Gammaproteobacteria bacterium]